MKTAHYCSAYGAETIATTCGVSLRTVMRWKATGRMPIGYALAVALLLDGDLGALSKAWRGWTLRRDQLYSPENLGFRPGEIASIPTRMALESELRRILGRPQQFELLA